ncbi:MAG TPA: type II toxin-antitoxin system VapB family antitoxin [Salinisphaeraceae bacterium]|nr:type II toxin-antitoxin system VapB family antitoxin [Salinisphaeraceae bacterium]
MRTTVTIDDDLMARALEAAGTNERSAVLREGLKALIEREAARRLIDLGGSVPDAELPPRRRPQPAAQNAMDVEDS